MANPLLDFFDEFDAPAQREAERKTERPKIYKAPFTYLGSKRLSLDYILPHLPLRSGYVEVFGGSGVVLLNRSRVAMEVYNDLYSGVTDFYKCVRSEELFQRLYDRVSLVLCGREEFETAKSNWEATEDIVERAALWYTLVQLSFIGKGRQFGRTTKPSSPTHNKIAAALDRFPYIHERLKHVQIENLPWQKCISDYDSVGTVFYLDPPYNVNEQNCYEHDINHEELLETIFKLKGYVALSGYGNALYDSYSWDDVKEWEVAAGKGSQDDERGQAVERLYIKR